jgi:KUP system potassium uptake protein
MAEARHIQFGGNVLEREKTKESTAYQRKMAVAEKEAEIASTWSDEPYGVEERDFKKKQVRTKLPPTIAWSDTC